MYVVNCPTLVRTVPFCTNRGSVSSCGKIVEGAYTEHNCESRELYRVFTGRFVITDDNPGTVTKLEVSIELPNDSIPVLEEGN